MSRGTVALTRMRSIPRAPPTQGGSTWRRPARHRPALYVSCVRPQPMQRRERKELAPKTLKAGEGHRTTLRRSHTRCSRHQQTQLIIRYRIANSMTQGFSRLMLCRWLPTKRIPVRLRGSISRMCAVGAAIFSVWAPAGRQRTPYRWSGRLRFEFTTKLASWLMDFSNCSIRSLSWSTRTASSVPPASVPPASSAAPCS